MIIFTTATNILGIDVIIIIIITMASIIAFVILIKISIPFIIVVMSENIVSFTKNMRINELQINF